MPQANVPKDEFVDLYALLDLPANADAARVRKKINELYLEAQKNLDHRNPRKRLQFQQMYEVYLPQARHLLLDAARRGEYDRYLQAFLSGQSIVASAGDTPSAAEPARAEESALPESGGTSGVPEKMPELSEAEQAELWSKWKSGLQIEVEEETATPSASATPADRPSQSPPATTVEATSRSTPATPAQQASTTTSPSPRPAPKPAPRSAGARPAPRVAGSPLEAEESEEEKHRREAAEFQRQQRRIQLIRATVQTAALMWRLAAGVGAFVLGCLLVLALDIYLARQGTYPLGLSRGLFNGLGIALVLVSSFGAGHYVSRRVRRRKMLDLSVLTYEELLRQTH